MTEVDLSATGVRALNAMLHGLAADTNQRAWRVTRPRGAHAIAAGLTARSRSRSTAMSAITAAG